MIVEEQLRLALGRTYKAIGEILIEHRVITPIQLDMALEEQRQNGKRLGTILMSHGWASEEDIAQAVADQLDIPWIDLKECPITLDALECVPEITARRYCMIPIDRKPDELTVAIADPANLLATDHLAATLGCWVRVVIATESQIMHAIETRYKDPNGTSRAARLGPYRIEKELKRYGAITAYRAMDSYLDRPVLLKVLSPLLSLTQQEYDRLRRDFLQNARLMGSLSHPNFPVLYEFGEEEHHSFYASEFLEGISIESLLKAMGTIPISRAIPIISQICDALEHAHRQGVVHGAIRPDNILLLEDGRVKLDGCQGIRASDASALVDVGTLIVTSNYLAPEQIKDEPVDRRADIFSLGVTLYEMLTNRKPFDASTIVAISHKIAYEPAPVPEDIPIKLQAIVMKALAKDPAERYQTATEMKHDLSAYRWQPDPSEKAESEAENGLEHKERQALAENLSIPLERPRRRLHWAWAVLPAVALCALLAFRMPPYIAPLLFPGERQDQEITSPLRVSRVDPALQKPETGSLTPGRPVPAPPKAVSVRIVTLSDFEQGTVGWSLAGSQRVIGRVSLSWQTGGGSLGPRWLRAAGLRFRQRRPEQVIFRYQLPAGRALKPGDVVKLEILLPDNAPRGLTARIGVQSGEGIRFLKGQTFPLRASHWTTAGGTAPRPVSPGSKLAVVIENHGVGYRGAVGLDALRLVTK